MTAASPSTVDVDLSTVQRVFVFAFIFAVFFVGDNFDLFYKLRTVTDAREATAAISTTGGGGSIRALVFVMLGLFGVVSWMWRPGGRRAAT